MKRKFIFLLFLLVVVTFTGCTQKDDEYISNTSNSLELYTENTGVSSEAEQKPEYNVFLDEKTSLANSFLYSSFLDTVSFINKNGEITGTYDVSKYEGNICGVYGDNIFYVCSEYNDDLQATLVRIYAKNIKNGEDTYFFSGTSYENMYIYKDMIYVYSHDWSTGEFVVDVFDADTFGPVFPDLSYYDDITGYLLANNTMSLYRNKSPEELLDEYGFMLLGRYGDSYSTDYFTYDKESITPIDLRADIVYGYNQRYVVYANYQNGVYTPESLCLYDMTDGTTCIVSKDYDGAIYLLDDEVIYKTFIYNEDGSSSYKTYSFDCTDKTTKLIYDADSRPGMGDFVPGYEGICKIFDEYYFMDMTDGAVSWYKENTDCTQVEKVGVIRALEWSEYATVESVGGVIVCPFCKAVIFQYYEDYFQLDASVCKGYVSLNKKLKENALNNYEFSKSSFYVPVDSSECDIHSTYMSQETETVTVKEVEFITMDYACIKSYGYWYGGGVHGYPIKNAVLVNLKTGEFVTIKDLYKGTENEFKTLVAKKTEEDFLTYENGSAPYFALSPEGVYEEAYETVSFDFTGIEFTMGGVFINYAPYEMGSFAEGYISVFITYEELGLADVFNSVG